jgi:imidazolonepropionase
MIDHGLIVALATDCNPGSCYTPNMQLILSLACMNMGMSIEEALTSATLHGAYALKSRTTMWKYRNREER